MNHESPASSAKKQGVAYYLESGLFASRWFLAPLYMGLVVGLCAVTIKFAQSTWHLMVHMLDNDTRQVTLEVLELVDITLVGNLILLVMFVGYENFVSRLGSAEGEDRPSWLGHVDYSGLKLKLIGSLIAISAIELLSDFLQPKVEPEQLGWRIGVHMTFVISALAFAVTDRIEHGSKNDNDD